MRALVAALVCALAAPACVETNGLCTDEDQQAGLCGPTGGGGMTGGGSGSGGVGNATYEQICEQAARNQCTAIGYPTNDYCFMVFSQSCSESDQAAAIAFCWAHPYIPHDASCHPQWI